jgi:catechol 2,3-dioxygenase-like lactoylglutathione lyase family enzyme
MHLNHLDLPVADVAATAAFFCAHLGFRQLDMRGNYGIAILQADDGFVLALTRLRAESPPSYPDNFHIGFLLDSAAAVHALHARLVAAGLPDLRAPAEMRGALLFYFHAPGGILVEVSHRPKHE